MKKLDHLQYIIIDLFCGAGGTTTGFEVAEWTAEEKRLLGLPENSKIAKVVACVNHDPIAIESHRANHPDVEHFQEDITTLYGSIRHGVLFQSSELKRLVRLVNIYRACYPGVKVILWGSLECTQFSNAKGGQPKIADSRTLAEHTSPYIVAIDPDFIKIENVVEFKKWGPLDEHGHPIKEREGESFNRWTKKICDLGYRNEWREINSADLGGLTARNRLFGCFAKTGNMIVWPQPTHAKNPAITSLFKPLDKWKPVKHALDLADVGTSIFNRKKRLAKKTIKRIYDGCVKHIPNKPDLEFLIKYYGTGENTSSGHEPAATIPTRDRFGKIHIDYILNPSWGQGYATSTAKPCPVIIARQDKAPLYLISCEIGPLTIPVYEDDCEWTVKLKEFMAAHGIADIKMRMLKVKELLVIQGFPKDYILLGNQNIQKKCIGNAVHPFVPEAWIKAPDYRTLKLAA